MTDPTAKLQGLRALNPWWTDPAARYPFDAPPPLRRDVFERVWERVRSAWAALVPGGIDAEGRGLLLTGLRRVGKSTVARQILEEVRLQFLRSGGGGPLTQVAYLDLDDARLREGVTLPDLLEAWKPFRDPRRPALAVIDEVHHLLEPEGRPWHRQLKGLVELGGIFVLATGSSATLLDEAAAEAPGRWRVLRLEPLSFREFRTLTAGGEQPLESRRYLDLERYLVLGGFPELLGSRSIVSAHESTRTRVRQVLDLEIKRTRQTDKLEHLHRVLVEFSGESLNVSNLCRSLGVERPTLDKWIDQLEQALLLRRLRRAGSTTLHELRGQPKLYAADPGIVAAFARLQDPIADAKTRARLQECAVLRHLAEIAESGSLLLNCLQRERDDRVEGETDFLLRTPGECFLVEVASHGGISQKATRQLALAREVARLEPGSRVHVVIVHAGADVSSVPVSTQPLATFLEALLPASAEEALRRLRDLSTEVRP